MRLVDEVLVAELGVELVAACRDRRAAAAAEDDAIGRRMRVQHDLVRVAGLSMPAVAALGVRLLAEAGWTAEQLDDAGVRYGGVRRAVARPT